MNNEFFTARGYEQKSYDEKFLTASMEDYLEMIYRCKLSGDEYIRLNKLATLLNVKDSSASKMMQKLRTLGLISYKKYGLITLTHHGDEIGKFLLERHRTIENFLKLVTSNEDVLVETELIEHIISNNTVESLKLLVKFFELNSDISIKFNDFKRSNDKI